MTKINLVKAIGIFVVISMLIPHKTHALSNCEMSANSCSELSGQVALEACERAISCMTEESLLPSIFSKVYISQGVLLGEMGRKDESLRAFRKAIQYEPNNAETYYDMGITLEDLGRDGEARRAYKKAVKFNPKLTLAWGNLGSVAYYTGYYKGAVKAFDTAIQLDPSYFDARPEQRKMWEKAVNVRPWSVAYGHELTFRFTDNIGYLFGVRGTSTSGVDQLVYLFFDGEADFQLYKGFFFTNSFSYISTTYKQPLSGRVNIFALTYGIKYCLMEDAYTPMTTDAIDNSRYWISTAVGWYHTSASASIATPIGTFGAANSEDAAGFDFGLGYDYYFHPNFGIGPQLKVYYVANDSPFMISVLGVSFIGRF